MVELKKINRIHRDLPISLRGGELIIYIQHYCLFIYRIVKKAT